MRRLDVAKGVAGAAVTLLFTVLPGLFNYLGYDTFGILAPYVDALATLAPFGLFAGGVLVGMFVGALWAHGKVAAAERERDEAVLAAERNRDEAVAAAERERDEAVAAAEREREKASRLTDKVGELNSEVKWLNAKLSDKGDSMTPEQRRTEFEEWLGERTASSCEVRDRLRQRKGTRPGTA